MSYFLRAWSTGLLVLFEGLMLSDHQSSPYRPVHLPVHCQAHLSVQGRIAMWLSGVFCILLGRSSHITACACLFLSVDIESVAMTAFFAWVVARYQRASMIAFTSIVHSYARIFFHTLNLTNYYIYISSIWQETKTMYSILAAYWNIISGAWGSITLNECPLIPKSASWVYSWIETIAML